ncbi:MAG: hypothetical protein N3A54_06390 [Patescibacteria group bacterium]|nr:hypothetical protein [Patescibacteria group bacterium]
MNISDISHIIELVVKIMALIGLGLYVIFAAIMIRQEHLMDKVIDETFEPVLRILVLIHLFAAIGLFGFAFITL